ncbi:hypothetical protein RvY_16767-2 [Ramazzottius varieornatus]|uniref:Uncharacterized protein n=1 Tax=Ramazzottius varieornatus TaxID=947166 RepID=A0A1D1VZP5_RAMVA|nr:hypothetical protein RvY_16767-2 [Ramazzottius varieornatus]
MTPSGQPHLSRNVSVVEQGVLQVEIITLALYYAAEMGSLFFVAPPYETALKDIKKHYPRLTVTQRIVTDPSYQNCNEWMAVSDDILARYYYRHRSRWREADMTIFLNTIAGTVSITIISWLDVLGYGYVLFDVDCDGHASIMLGGALNKLVIRYSQCRRSSSDHTGQR